MEDKKTLAEKLLSVQNKLKAPKNQTNTFSPSKYKYRNCEDILEAVKPLLLEEGLLLRISDEIVLIGERYYIKATAKISTNDYMDFIDVSAYAREDENKKGMDVSQITGSASSYARKYALNGLFLIDDTKDADYAPAPEKVANNEQVTQPKPTREQIIKKCLEYTKVLGYDESEMTEYLENGTDGEVIERYTMLNKQIKARG